jgi:ABC-type glycerol-3-phosphate transport system substrate-binding protein
LGWALSAAITSGVVPDTIELADFSFLPLNAWADKLIDVSDIVEPVKSQYNTWDAFLDFFMPVQDKLRAQGMRNIYSYGYQLTSNGVDPGITFQGFLMAYGGKNLVTQDGKLHTDDPQVKDAAVKAIAKLTTPFKKGYVPPGVVNWNDADDNNAFHAKLIVMDFDGRFRPKWPFIRKRKNTTTS